MTPLITSMPLARPQPWRPQEAAQYGSGTKYFGAARAILISPTGNPCTRYLHHPSRASMHMLNSFTTSGCCFLELLPRYWGHSEQLIAPAIFPNFWCRGNHRKGFFRLKVETPDPLLPPSLPPLFGVSSKYSSSCFDIIVSVPSKTSGDTALLTVLTGSPPHRTRSQPRSPSIDEPLGSQHATFDLPPLARLKEGPIHLRAGAQHQRWVVPSVPS